MWAILPTHCLIPLSPTGSFLLPYKSPTLISGFFGCLFRWLVGWFLSPLCLIFIACMNMSQKLYVEHGKLTRGYTTEENGTPSPDNQ